MKPLRLEIQGFGSFPGTEVIDFAALSTRGLFVVTGPTGSGKTTIFDAMVFALYGDLPGGRKSGGARSQHAPAMQPTQVVFDFEVDGVAYRVTRNPEYERPKKTGKGLTPEKANATLVRLDADTTAVESGAKLCADRCKELVGLEQAQFERVVLLPQGEFDKFLTASESDREDLLRQLFGGEIYSRLMDLLAARSKQLAVDVADAKRQIEFQRQAAWVSICDARSVLDGGSAPDPTDESAADALVDDAAAVPMPTDVVEIAAALDAESQRLEKLGPELRAADSAAQKAREAAQDAKTKADLFDELANQRAKQHEHELQRDAMEAQEQSVERSSAARPVVERADAAAESHRHAEAAARDLEAIRNDVHSTLRALSCPSADVPEPQPTAVAAELQTAQNRVQDQSNQLQDALDARAELDTADAAAKAAEAARTVAKQHLDNCEAEHAKTELAVAAARAGAGRQEATTAALETARSRLAQRGDLDALRGERATFVEREQAADAQYRDTMQAYLASTAPRLAASLVDGAPCMVCGSLEHPAPATPDDDVLVVEHEQLLAEQERWRAAKSAIALHDGRIQEAVTALGADADVDLEVLHGAVTAAEQDAREAREADSALAAAQTALERARVELDDAREKLQECVDASATARGAIQPLRDASERLDAVVADLDADSIAAERAVLDAVGDLADRYAAAVDAQRRATQRAGLDADAAATALAVSPFADAAEARAELLESGVESDWRAAVEAWREKAGRLVNELAGLEKADVPPVRPDVDAAQHAAATAEDRAKALRDLTQRAKTFLDGARKALDEADRIDVESAELRQQAETARLVAETCAGKGGLLRMRLDRWVLAAELERVANAANVHLARLTRHRYQLRRSINEGREKLELVVFDAYSGAERSTGSLSGGEKFQASLALALGLADVVSHGGTASGRNYEALFVDEGFGSLDPEALDQAISALASLQQGGRMVGAITHVEAMKQQLHVGIEVQRLADNGGSTLVVSP